MDERILEQLENVPYNGKDAYLELEEILYKNAKSKEITEEEKQRLNYELSLIKKWGIEKVFLFGLNLSLSVSDSAILVAENNSYVNYLLGITKVNPVFYDLPFERFFNEKRKALPGYYIIVEKGKEVKLLKSIYEKFGKSTIIKSVEDNENYFISNKPFDSKFIKENVIVAKPNEESYKKNVSILTFIELAKLGFYSFSVKEVEEITYSTKKIFSKKDIYEKYKNEFSYENCRVETFTGINEIEKILKSTENKLVYQEQLMEILNKICGFDMATADYFRREIGKAKKESLKEMQKILLEKYGENGQKLFDYLYKTGKYTILKAYVIACLHNLIEY